MDKPRAGFTFVEVAVATVLMAVLLVAVAHALALVAQQRRISRYRVVATEEAANIVDRLMARPYNELTPSSVDTMDLSQGTQAALPRPSLRIELNSIETVPRGKRMAVEIRWSSPAGPDSRPVRVVTWRYDTAGETP